MIKKGDIFEEIIQGNLLSVFSIDDLVRRGVNEATIRGLKQDKIQRINGNQNSFLGALILNYLIRKVPFYQIKKEENYVSALELSLALEISLEKLLKAKSGNKRIAKLIKVKGEQDYYINIKDLHLALGHSNPLVSYTQNDDQGVYIMRVHSLPSKPSETEKIANTKEIEKTGQLKESEELKERQELIQTEKPPKHIPKSFPVPTNTEIRPGAELLTNDEKQRKAERNFYRFKAQKAKEERAGGSGALGLKVARVVKYEPVRGELIHPNWECPIPDGCKELKVYYHPIEIVSVFNIDEKDLINQIAFKRIPSRFTPEGQALILSSKELSNYVSQKTRFENIQPEGFKVLFGLKKSEESNRSLSGYGLNLVVPFKRKINIRISKRPEDDKFFHINEREYGHVSEEKIKLDENFWNFLSTNDSSLRAQAHVYEPGKVLDLELAARFFNGDMQYKPKIKLIDSNVLQKMVQEGICDLDLALAGEFGEQKIENGFDIERLYRIKKSFSQDYLRDLLVNHKLREYFESCY